MDLYLINQMTAEEIAEVKQISIGEVEAVIREVNQELKKELSSLVNH
jgi:DNA-directed RNA polymerase specialized sigma24 family protein